MCHLSKSRALPPNRQRWICLEVRQRLLRWLVGSYLGREASVIPQEKKSFAFGTVFHPRYQTGFRRDHLYIHQQCFRDSTGMQTGARLDFLTLFLARKKLADVQKILQAIHVHPRHLAYVFSTKRESICDKIGIWFGLLPVPPFCTEPGRLLVCTRRHVRSWQWRM